MTNYKNGKIYELICNKTGEKYIGSTTQTLKQRLSKHTSGQNCSSKDIIQRGDYNINLLEDYPCGTKLELLTRERYWINTNDSINKNRPQTTEDEKKEYMKEWQSNYRMTTDYKLKLIEYLDKNKDKIKINQKKYRDLRKIYLEELSNYNLTDIYMEVPAFDPFQYKPNISASSRKLYTFNLMKLNGGKPLKDLKFLSKPEEILGKLEEVKPNTRRTYLIAIVSALKDRPEAKFKKLYAKFYEPLDKLNKSLKDNTEKTEKVKENWMEQSDINSRLEDLKKIIPEIKDKKKISPEEYQQLLHLVVLSLYTLQAPRRNKDYIDCLIVRKVPEDTTKNYLDITEWNWVFNNYKTQKKYNKQVIPVEPELKEILELYLKFHPQAKEISKKKCAVQFLPLNSSTDMTRMLNKILGKKVGCSMIRAIYLTNKFGESHQDLQETTNAMGTSVETAQNNYIKKD